MKVIMNKINRRFESDARTICGIIVRSAVGLGTETRYQYGTGTYGTGMY